VRVDFKTGTFYLGDCFEVMAELAASSVDMVLNDPPYGTTACAWDSVLPLKQMWPEYWRLLKANGAAVLTASQPFTTTLITSQIDRFKYEAIWFKHQAVNPFFAKLGLLKVHENICVFYGSPPTYNPQFEYGKEYARFKSRIGSKIGEVYGHSKSEHTGNPGGRLYPTSALYFPGNSGSGGERDSFHPTQKPVALFEYLIRTYTNQGELVLDNTAGSGTTAIAAIQSGRRWICIERDEDYFAKAIARVWDAEALL
jgi:site-specific DNA-methyltransferase (adenine-specific)